MVGLANSLGLGLTRNVVGGGGGAPAEDPPTLPTITSWQGMFDDNASNLSVWSTTNIALDDDIQAEGDSLTNGDFGGSVTVGQEWAAQLGDYISSTINKTAVSGSTSAAIETRMAASGASVLDNYTLFNAGTNDSSSTPDATTTNIDDIAALLTTGKFGVWVPLVSTEYTSSTIGLFNSKIANHIYDTYWPNVLDMQQLHAAAVGDSANATDQLQAATGDVIDSLSDDGLHQNASGHDKHTEPAARLLGALNDKAPYVPDHPPIAFDPTVTSGTSLYTVQKVGTANGFDITGGNAGGEFAISDAGVVSRGAGAWSDTDGIRELFVTGWANSNDVYHTARLPMVAKGSLGDAVRWGRCSMVAEDVLGASVPQATMLLRCDYTTPGGSRKTVIDFEDGSIAFVGSSIRNMKFANLSSQTAGTRNFGTWTGMNWIILSYDATADSGSGRYYWSDFVNNSHGSGAAFNSGGNTNLSGRLDLGVPFGSTFDEVDFEYLAIWPSSWDLTSSTERDKFYNSSTGARAFADNGVIDGITPAIYLAGGPGDWLAEFSTGTMQVNNRGSFSGSSIYQMPFADVSLAGIKGV
jgi:lysophospholipase L1-like esterase